MYDYLLLTNDLPKATRKQRKATMQMWLRLKGAMSHLQTTSHRVDQQELSAAISQRNRRGAMVRTVLTCALRAFTA